MEAVKSTTGLAAVWQSQNFIENSQLVSRLLDMTDVGKSDTVVEIGPGRGAITAKLAERAGSVIAVEKDSNLVRKITHGIALQYPNIKVVEENFLHYSLPQGRYKVVANIPFNLTAEVMKKLFMGRENYPESAYLIMQKEAGEKFAGTPKATLSSVLLKVNFDIEILTWINRREFVPAPRVDAVFVAFVKRPQPLINASELGVFQDFVAYGYIHTQKNKSAADSLQGVFTSNQRRIIERRFGLAGLKVVNLDTSHWVDLFESFQKYVSDDRKIAVRGAWSKLAKEQSQLPKTHRTRRW